MRLSEDKIRRVAERIHDELGQKGLLAYKDPRGSKPGAGRALRVKAIYDYIVEDLQRDAQIDAEVTAEVNRILDSYSRELKGTERDVMFRKHKDELMRKRGQVM